MNELFYSIVRRFFEKENVKEFFESVKNYYHKQGIAFFYYIEDEEFKELFFNDKNLETLLEGEKIRKSKFQLDNFHVYRYFLDNSKLIMKVSGGTQIKSREIEDFLDLVANMIEKMLEIKLYRINSFISPFFYEISKIFHPKNNLDSAMEEFRVMLDGIFGIKILKILKGKKNYYYCDTKTELEPFEAVYKNLMVSYISERKLDKNIEIDKIMRIVLFLMNIFLESKLLDEQQREFLEYQIVSKENLTKLNKILEKSLYKMTFISNLYKKLSQVREINNAIEIVDRFLKNEIGYDYLLIECGADRVEQGEMNSRYDEEVFEEYLLDGKVLYRIKICKTEISNEEGVYISLIFNNSKIEIENILLYKRVEELAIIDGVTELYIHRYFIDTLEKEIEVSVRYSRDLSLIMLDIDNFKLYNDTYGHLEGDKALNSVASVIKESIRKVDIACRYGGEEFIIIVPHTEINNSAMLAERIRKNIEEKTRVTVSVGVTQYIVSEERDMFIKRADQCMYEAKRSGKNRVIRK